ncbi:MAG: ATP-binding protein [Nanoarchaeota archaeon]
MVLSRLYTILKNEFRGKEVLHNIDLPSLAVVKNLEVAEDLKERYPQTQLLVAHLPDVLKRYYSYGKFQIDGEQIEGYILPGKKLGNALAHIYASNGFKSRYETQLRNLEAAIEQESVRRFDNQSRLSQLAETFNADGVSDTVQLLEFIKRIITGQFEHIEYFIRELIQNSAAAASDPAKHRIDVYLDRENRIIRVADNGCGMTPEVMEKVYFNFGESLNRFLAHAAGKFGAGVGSCYALGHESVTLDSLTEDGLGGRTSVDKNLYREGFTASQRTVPGTTTEINLSADSEVDFDRVVRILKEDCCYVETPIYLHLDGARTEKINKPLNPEIPDTVCFKEEKVEGYLTKADYGRLDLLSHRIRLKSVKSIGYKGAINCNELDTILSRDIVTDDPVLKYVLMYAEHKSRLLSQGRSPDLKTFSLESRITDYREFIKSTLFNKDGSLNETWIANNFTKIDQFSSQRFRSFEPILRIRAVYSAVDKCYGKLISTIFSKIPKLKDFDKEKVEESAYVATILGGAGLGFAGFFMGAITYGICETFAPSFAYNYLDKFMSRVALSYFIYLGAVASMFAPLGIEAGIKGLNYLVDGHFERKVTRKKGYEIIGRFDQITADGFFGKRKNVEIIKKGYSWAKGLGIAGVASFLGSKLISYLNGYVGDLSTSEALDYSKIRAKKEALEHVASPEAYALVNNLTLSINDKLVRFGPDSDLAYYGMAALGTASLGFLLYKRRKTKLLEPHKGKLSTAQDKILNDIKGRLSECGDVEAYYGKNLEQMPFYITKGKVVLNPGVEINPWSVALLYATDVLKDAETARTIANKNLGVLN